MRTSDLTTREVSALRPQLAEELVFTPQTHGHEIYYHIEAPSQGNFYRVGYGEYAFLSLLDGSVTVAQALTINARSLGTRALTRAQGLELVEWLLANRLARLPEVEPGWSTPGAARPSTSDLLRRLNPFWLKVPLGSPDRVLAALVRWLGWIFSPLATAAGMAVILLGIACLVVHADRFVASSVTVLAPHNWLWLGLAWLMLKILHELAHGLACKYYRGEVREAGVTFILLAPLAFVDVTSCWRFPSRWQRIHVAAAGIYIELLVAALAALFWVRVDSSVAEHLLYNLIVMASATTLLFNANPLMRFDGYYILADLLEIPNLATEGAKSLRNLTSRFFYGAANNRSRMLGYRLWCVRAYGILSAVWRLVVCCSLITAASVLLHGTGLLLSLAAAVGWFGLPLLRLAADLQRRYYEARVSCFRALCLASLCAAGLSALLLWVPWPGALRAPVIVEYADLSIVRSGVAGFVQQVHVSDGQAVQQDQLLVELRNDELETEHRTLELEVQQGRVKHRVALDQKNAAEAQIALRNLQSIQERLAEVRQRTEALSIRAPVAGRVVARNLQQQLGTYVREGDEMLAVGDETRKELVVSVGQREIDVALPRVGDATRFRIHGRWARHGRLDRLQPRATTELPHPAMSSLVGGPLAVTENDRRSTTDARLAEPRFRGVISLPAEQCQDLGAGEQGYALLGLGRESIGQVVWLGFHHWWERLLRPIQG